MGIRRRIIMKFQGNLIPSKNPSFQLGLGLVPHRLSVVANSCFHSNPCSNNDDDNNFGSKGNNKFLNDSSKLFEMMYGRTTPPSVVKFSRLLDDVTKTKQISCSLNSFKQRCATGVPSVNNYITAVKCYYRLGHSKLGFSVLCHCYKQGIQPPVSIYNTILKGFIREDKTHEAERLFSKLIQKRLWDVPDVVTYNTMIQGLCKIGNNYTAIALLRLMDHGTGVNCKPDILTYNTIIHSLCNDTVIMIDDAFKLFNEMVFRKAITPDVFTYNSLIYALSKLGRWDDVSGMLKQMQDATISPQLETFNIIVDALSKQRSTSEAQLVINIMLDTPTRRPNIVTYNSLIEGYCLRNEMTAARTLFDSLPSKSIKPNIATYNHLLDGYIKDFKIREASDLYEDLINKTKPVPDVVTLYFMYRVGEIYLHPSKTVGEMQSQFEFPDPRNYAFFLNTLGCHEDALVLFHLMDGSKLNSELDVYNFLIQGAFKYGKPDGARRLFHHMRLKGLEPGLDTYIYMMSGFCHEGLIKDATKLHLKILKRNLPPNGIINNALIQGYLKNKPFPVARKLLREMKDKHYRITASNWSLYFDQFAATQTDSKLREAFLKMKPKDCHDVLDSYRTYTYEILEGAPIYWGPNIKDPYTAGLKIDILGST